VDEHVTAAVLGFLGVIVTQLGTFAALWMRARAIAAAAAKIDMTAFNALSAQLEQHVADDVLHQAKVESALQDLLSR
jgi:ABC-type uncharacterized transport system permease subunit